MRDFEVLQEQTPQPTKNSVNPRCTTISYPRRRCRCVKVVVKVVTWPSWGVGLSWIPGSAVQRGARSIVRWRHGTIMRRATSCNENKEGGGGGGRAVNTVVEEPRQSSNSKYETRDFWPHYIKIARIYDILLENI